ncbi:hypothetical protein Fsol_00360 [Candidatus Fokinia solitaria]|uniref:Uncharacterized protein n=1 Tax=Candidatus Fokinia solitaria TaxID=1802984 RepID=A0A2U8BS80_9RICK|nr:hypothetical protein [Candidatus Fokinia solitaria]AWD33158.1 hypothetical protein Fsol_00360 [Candidatus Fokinia solitaria]
MIAKNDTQNGTQNDLETLIHNEIKKRCEYISKRSIDMLLYLLEKKEDADAFEIEDKFKHELEDNDLQHNLFALWKIMYGHSQIIPENIRYSPFYNKIIHGISMELFVMEMQLLLTTAAPLEVSRECDADAQSQQQQCNGIDENDDGGSDADFY